MIEKILRNTKLIEIGNTWVLVYNEREYLRLLSATSRDDAEQQIAEMLFIRDLSEAHFAKYPQSAEAPRAETHRPAETNRP